jgi:D-glycero-D-manno-heptose 1,7-bisphosphate phosphatase
MRRVALLDRDGTLIKEKHYLADPAQVELILGVGEGLRRLSEMGVGLFVVTNQSGIGRGFYTADQMNLVHERMFELLALDGVRLDGIYHCPHHPEDGCGCRKPATGLVKSAERDFGFSARDGIVVGDKACDIELGKQLGATTFLVRTGYGEEVAREGHVVPDYTVKSLAEAVPLIETMYS